ncbi:MAG: hypothetical protein IH908_14765, partial [Proteobacteria bacterium]|nr:hypothetical protein [Pseudomonadota bacterium]
TKLAQDAGFAKPTLKVTPGSISRKGKVYVAVPVTLAGEAKLEDLCKFLFLFHEMNLPHRIVSIRMDTSQHTGDPALKVNLTAEALVFPDAISRRDLHPETKLVDGLTPNRKPQNIKVEDASGFALKPGFRIQIGEEILTVTAIGKDHAWTVQGGIDGSKPALHEKGATVTLPSINPTFKDRKEDDYLKTIAQNSPFVKPAPKTTPIAATKDDIAADTSLIAFFEEDGVRQAWLYDSKRRHRTVLRKGTDISEFIDDFDAVCDALVKINTKGTEVDAAQVEALLGAVSKTAEKRVILKFHPQRYVSWDHSKLGGKY